MPADDGTFKTRLSTKGQVVLPKELRRRLRWEPGSELVIEATGEGVLLKQARPFPPTRLEDVAGCLRRPGIKPATLDEMDEAVAAEFRRQYALDRH